MINREVLWRLAGFGLLIATATLAVYWWMLQQDVSLELARSVAMTQIVLFQFFHALNCRSFHRSIFRIPLRDNPFLGLGLLAALLAHLGALHLPFMQAIFETEPLAPEHWGIVVPIALLIVAAAEADKAFIRRPRHQKALRGRDREREAARTRMEEGRQPIAEDQNGTEEREAKREKEEGRDGENKRGADADTGRSEEDRTARGIGRSETERQEGDAEYRKQTEYRKEVEYESAGGEEYRKETEYRREVEYRRKPEPGHATGKAEPTEAAGSIEPETAEEGGSGPPHDEVPEERRPEGDDEHDDEPPSPE